MSEAKHTPGPWHRNIKPAKKYNTIFAGRNTHVAHLETHGLTEEEIEANCNLITAAPDMFKKLKELVRLMNIAFEAEENPFGIHHNDATDALSAAEVEIANIEGRV